ncbi:hypothetical protein [Sorangium sp. So ce1000]|uniref:hypothetical protein n=1 Tax=Sorangium sp. So ce1000 TaxID=3133325 RepID=UPI003F63892A
MHVVHHSSHTRWIAGGLAAPLLALLAGCSDQALGAPLAAPGDELPPRFASSAGREPPQGSAGQGEAAPRSTATAAAPRGRDELLREAGRLAEIRAVFARSPEAPLALLDAHRAEFPEGQLAAEREIVAIDALLRSGRVDQARTRATGFLVQFPASPHADRVRRLTGAAP